MKIGKKRMIAVTLTMVLFIAMCCSIGDTWAAAKEEWQNREQMEALQLSAGRSKAAGMPKASVYMTTDISPEGLDGDETDFGTGKKWRTFD